MIKIIISGKSKSGKDTVASMIQEKISNKAMIKKLSFAGPIKKIIQIMAPQIDSKDLYGSSELRAKTALGNVSIRQMCLDIGALGRSYDPDVWIKVIDHQIKEDPYVKCFIITDCRFINEFNWAKDNDFITIRVKRDIESQIPKKPSRRSILFSIFKNIKNIYNYDPSEQEQDFLPDSAFDYIIHNNGTLEQTKEQVKQILDKLAIH